MKKILLLIIGLYFSSVSLYAENNEEYVNFCKIYTPKNVAYYETHTKITKEFCLYYFKLCNKEFEPLYEKSCKLDMNSYQPLYNTNKTIAMMHVLYNDNFDRS
ncbi:hypothetical protein [Francisella frigiditurris]|uniref:Uncharacterized protein n=1 Tax=Francisella frigiditurris TaxID=1542390 RepID=A0A1J0KV20_9GAMM|nr:hypothetical protein [Francisella frigiditurris]APC97460.1 hypothetical protein KX01_1130 [Francisella frigiditurris]